MDAKDRSKNRVKSINFRRGKKTFFFDVNTTSNNGKYLKVTESRFMGEGEDRVRNSVVVFPEEVMDFQQYLKDIVGYLN